MQNPAYNLRRVASYLLGFVLFYEPFMLFNQLASMLREKQSRFKGPRFKIGPHLLLGNVGIYRYIPRDVSDSRGICPHLLQKGSHFGNSLIYILCFK